MSVICEAFEGPQLTEEFCANLAKTLKLSFTQHLAFSLALAQSTQSSVQQQGRACVHGARRGGVRAWLWAGGRVCT